MELILNRIIIINKLIFPTNISNIYSEQFCLTFFKERNNSNLDLFECCFNWFGLISINFGIYSFEPSGDRILNQRDSFNFDKELISNGLFILFNQLISFFISITNHCFLYTFCHPHWIYFNKLFIHIIE